MLSLHSSNEPDELSQWPRHDDSTIIIGISVIKQLGPVVLTNSSATYCRHVAGISGRVDYPAGHVYGCFEN